MSFTNKNLVIDTSNFSTTHIWRLNDSDGYPGFVLTTDGYGGLNWLPPATGGLGTVTSVGITGNNGITVSDSPVTESGDITLGLGDITPNSLTTTDYAQIGSTLSVFGKIYGNDQSEFKGIVSIGDTSFNNGLLRIYGTTDGSGGTAQVYNNAGQPGIILSGGIAGQGGQFDIVNGWHQEFSVYTDTTDTNLKLFQKDTPNLGFHVIGGNGTSTGSVLRLNGLNLNGNLEFLTTSTDVGDTEVVLRTTSNDSNVVDLLLNSNAGSVKITKLIINEKLSVDSNISGNAVLSSGTITVYTPAINIGSTILLTVGPLGTVTSPQAIYWDNIVPGTSFDIISTDSSDTSTISWLIIN